MYWLRGMGRIRVVLSPCTTLGYVYDMLPLDGLVTGDKEYTRLAQSEKFRDCGRLCCDRFACGMLGFVSVLSVCWYFLT